MPILNLINGLFRAKVFGTPFYTHYYVSRRCYFRCKMCSIWKYGDKEEEPSLPVIEKIADRMSRMKVSNVVFTGGEPFIRDDLPEIVEVFSKRGMTVRLQTTGAPNISEERFERAISAGVQHLTISLDTLDKKKQDDICRSKGLWESAVNLIKAGVSLLPKGVVVVNTVVTSQNIRELPRIVEFVTSLDAYSSIVPVHLVNSPDKPNPIRSYCEEFSFKESDFPIIKDVYNVLLDMKKDGLNIGSSSKFLRDSMEVIISGNQKWRCDAGKYYFVVYPDGAVSLCDDFPPRWNILDESFLEEFRSPETRADITRSILGCDGCIYGCWRETSYLLSDVRVLFEQSLTFGKRILFGLKKRGKRN